jgi:hypothetical protein
VAGMAYLSPVQAAAVNVVISHFADSGSNPSTEVVLALRTLAAAADGGVAGGWHEDAVRRQWPTAFDDVQRAPSDPTDEPVDPRVPTNPA